MKTLAPSFAALLLVAVLAPAPSAQLFRTIDGSGNNPFHPDWGQAGSELLRLTEVDYEDGISAPAGSHRRSPREISNAGCAQAAPVPNAADVTDFVWQWGQFIDHDLDLTEAASPPEPFDILVPLGDLFFDPFMTGAETITLDRSAYAPHAPTSPRQQVNALSAFLDGSMVYGSDEARALALRELDGTGRLKVSAGDLLPFNTDGLPNAPDANDPSFFVAGDVRANEQIGLTAMHTLFVREHNFFCNVFKNVFPFLDEDSLYELARCMVGAEIQAITYQEFLPVLLGPDAIPPYTGWNPSVDPGIANAFSTAAYRFGHTMLSPVLQRLEADGSDIAAGPIALEDAFFNPSAILDEGGIEPILRGLASQRPQEVDTLVVDDVRNFLFGPPGAGGFDLASLNLQRGRDHGLASYNQARVDFGLAPAATFADISSSPDVQAALASVYDTPDDVDLWVGGLAEDHVPGALVGELFRTILADQFTRLRNGDLYWYQNNLVVLALFGDFVPRQTLARVIRRNTSIGSEIQDKAFLLPGAP